MEPYGVWFDEDMNAVEGVMGRAIRRPGHVYFWVFVASQLHEFVLDDRQKITSGVSTGRSSRQHAIFTLSDNSLHVEFCPALKSVASDRLSVASGRLGLSEDGESVIAVTTTIDE